MKYIHIKTIHTDTEEPLKLFEIKGNEGARVLSHSEFGKLPSNVDLGIGSEILNSSGKIVGMLDRYKTWIELVIGGTSTDAHPIGRCMVSMEDSGVTMGSPMYDKNGHFIGLAHGGPTNDGKIYILSPYHFVWGVKNLTVLNLGEGISPVGKKLIELGIMEAH